MTVTYFSKSSSIGPSSRYRVFQFLPSFSRRKGSTVRLILYSGRPTSPFLRYGRARYGRSSRFPMSFARFLKRLWTLLTLGRRDLVVIEGQLFPYAPPVAERLLSWCRHRVVVEMDDAIYLTPGHEKKMPALFSMARGAIVGNDRLAAYATQFSSHVTVVPTVVDTERFVPERSRLATSSDRSGETITIVWIGLAYNLKYLDVLAPALRAFKRGFT